MRNILFILLLFSLSGYSQSVHIDGPTGRVSDLDAVITVAATDLIVVEHNDSSKKILHTDFSVLIDNVRGDSIVWEDLRVPAQNTRINPTKSEPAFEAWLAGLFAFHFDAANDSTNSLHFAAQLPHAYKEGSDIYPHVHWSPTVSYTHLTLPTTPYV